MKSKILLLITLAVFCQTTWSQQCGDTDVYCFDESTVTTCHGFFAFNENPIGTDESDTITFYPGTNGGMLTVHFDAELECEFDCDLFTVYDGSNTSAAPIGTFSGNELQGVNLFATNSEGSLTFVFTDIIQNGNFSLTHIQAEFACSDPCLAGTVVSIPASYNNEANGLAQYCFGQEVTLDATGSVAPNGYTASEYRWHFDDSETQITQSPTVTHTYTLPGIYTPSLEILWSTGCLSSATSSLSIVHNNDNVITPENPIIICTGTEIVLTGGATIESVDNQPPTTNEDHLFLADGSGFSYESEIIVGGYQPGAVINSCSEITSIGVNMEHSYMGDLNISVECPNGTEVNFVCWGTNGGGSTFLGEPIDDESPDAGIGYDYFWSPDATNGTWGDNATGFLTPLPSGIYQSCEDMCDFTGCPLNGEWIIHFTDNLGADNGNLFSWSIDFNNTDFMNFLFYQPTIGEGADSSYWSTPDNFPISSNGDEITLSSIVPASTTLTYTAINSAGCESQVDYSLDFVSNNLVATAGADFFYGLDSYQLAGDVWLENDLCDGEEIMEFCTEANETLMQAFCSEDLFGCIEPIRITVMSGDFNDFGNGGIYATNGDDFNGSYLGYFEGSITGTVITSDENGCISLTYNSPWDGTSCQAGDMESLIIKIERSFDNEISYYWEDNLQIESTNSLVSIISPTGMETDYVLHAELTGTYGCEVTDTVTVNMPQYIINGVVFYDEDMDGIFDVNETIIPYFAVYVNANSSMIFTGDDGSFTAFVAPDVNTITINVDGAMWTATTPTSYTTTLSENVTVVEDQNFGVVANLPTHSGVIHTNHFNSICNTISTHNVTIFNNGNVPLSGILTYTLDPQSSYQGGTAATVNGNIITFNVENLGINQSIDFQLYVLLPDANLVGQWLSFDSQFMDMSNPDEVLATADFSFQLMCSYDPNQKNETTGYGVEGWKSQNETLIYTIQFQNIGNAPAHDVIILDELPATLNWLTLQPISSSHSFHASVDNWGVAVFEFANIMLPDSTNDEPGSHGFITFSIEQMLNLDPGTIIENNAHIFFDQNEAVITNQTLNTIIFCEDIPTTLTYINGNLECTPDAGGISWYENGNVVEGETGSLFTPAGEGEYYASIEISDDCILQTPSEFIGLTSSIPNNQVQLYPNPVSEKLRWNTSTPVSQLNVYSSTGALAKTIRNTKQSNQGIIDVSELPDGIYVIHFMMSDESIITKRVSISGKE